MNEPKPQQEPSMEEILASIRRIISEDDGEAESAPAEPRAAESDQDILDLTEEVQKDGTVVNLDTGMQVGEPVAAEPDTGVVELELKDVIDVSDSTSDEDRIVSEPTEKAAAASMASFASTLARERGAAAPVSDPIALGAADRTIEDIVREVMRPLIKEWLDSNLPGMVERLVERELERLSRRAS